MKKPFSKTEIILISKIFFIFVGVFFGSWFFFKAFGTLAFESEGTPPESYFFTLYSFFPFLLFVLLGGFFPRLSGYLMVANGLAAFFLFFVSLRECSPHYIDPPTLSNFIITYSGPMILLGMGFSIVGIFQKNAKLSENQDVPRA